MKRQSPIKRITDTAEDQWGLITRRQAADAGIPRATMDRLTKAPAVLERVASGVYHLAGAPAPDHLGLRAAWLQLAPATPAWERTPSQGVVSHRSAASLYGLGHLPDERHEFTLPMRRQSRRKDVRLHRLVLRDEEWVNLRGILVTRPARIAADLLADHEDPTAIAHVIADALRAAQDSPGATAQALAPYAAQFRLPLGDGAALMQWLLELVADRDTERWLEIVRERTDVGIAAP